MSTTTNPIASPKIKARPPRSGRRVPNKFTVLPYLTAIAVTLPLGAAIALLSPAAVGFACAFALGFLAVLRGPALSLVAIALFAGFLGRTGAHWITPLGIPVPELLLLMGATAAGLRILASAHYSSARELALWIPSALVAALLLAFFNQGDPVSGVRDAAIFAYPFLIALVITSVDRARLRTWVVSTGAAMGMLGFVLAIDGLGAFNLVSGAADQLATGQPRALSGEYSAPLAAGLFLGIWHAVNHSVPRLMAMALILASLAGLLLVNLRSGYLAIPPVILIELSLLWHGVARLRVLRAAALVVVSVLALALFTPIGSSGLERLTTLTNPNDPTTQFRKDALSATLEVDGTKEVIAGSGVGAQPTELLGGYQGTLGNIVSSTDRLEPHNGFASIYDRAGLIGLLAVIIPLLIAARIMLRPPRDPLQALLVSLALFLLLTAMANVVLENLYWGFWFWLPLAIGIHLATGPPIMESESADGQLST